MPRFWFMRNAIPMIARGRAVETYHTIYRIENEEGVSGWAETSAQWDPWYQSKPEIRARVITSDGVEHILDLKTLNDVPAHENSPDTYTDQRSFGGPLPAISVGAIVEEEITIRDTAPFFSAGIVERSILDRSVPVNKTRIIISHPESLPFHYVMQQMPGAKVNKTSHDGIETIEIEDGPYEARSEKLTNLPPMYPAALRLSFLRVPPGRMLLRNMPGYRMTSCASQTCSLCSGKINLRPRRVLN